MEDNPTWIMDLFPPILRRRLSGWLTCHTDGRLPNLPVSKRDKVLWHLEYRYGGTGHWYSHLLSLPYIRREVKGEVHLPLLSVSFHVSFSPTHTPSVDSLRGSRSLSLRRTPLRHVLTPRFVSFIWGKGVFELNDLFLNFYFGYT